MYKSMKSQPIDVKDSIFHIDVQEILHKPNTQLRKTKIVCTLGPSTNTTSKIVAMLDAGMDIARFNFSHGTHDTHIAALKSLKEALKQRPEKVCATMIDTKGSAIFTGPLKDHVPISLVSKEILEICDDLLIEGNNKLIACSSLQLIKSAKKGDKVLISDGSITCEVTEVKDNSIITTIINGGILGEHKNMSIPGVKIDICSIAQDDKDSIKEFCYNQGFDIIALSYCKNAAQIEECRKLLGQKANNVKIIAKIENEDGLLHFDEILEASDGIMVARGDLGMDIPPEKVFVFQKWIISRCNVAAKPVITATQMLESMIKSPTPTRAEATDIANAVLDGTDCVMLSGETAVGEYAIEAISIMSKVCVQAENCSEYKLGTNFLKKFPFSNSVAEVSARAAVSASIDLKADFILVFSEDTVSPRYIAKYRPNIPVFSCTTNPRVVKAMLLSRCLTGILMPSFHGIENLIQRIIAIAKKRGIATEGGKVVCLHGIKDDQPDSSDLIKILCVK